MTDSFINVSLLNLSVLQSSIFLALPSNFFDKKGKYLLYTFDTFLEVAAPAKLPYPKKLFLYGSKNNQKKI